MGQSGEVRAGEPTLYAYRFNTVFGRMSLIWEREGGAPVVVRIVLPASGKTGEPFPSLAPGRCPAVATLAERISAFLRGRAASFDLSLLRLDLCHPFQRKVLLAEYRIPRGRISTYGRIARHLGRPGSARAVGSALARNPFPIVIPCHRALRSDLSLGGYQGGLAMKRRLLEMEGIRFEPSGRAVTDAIYY